VAIFYCISKIFNNNKKNLKLTEAGAEIEAEARRGAGARRGAETGTGT
jgi:hypothetical protein